MADDRKMCTLTFTEDAHTHVTTVSVSDYKEGNTFATDWYELDTMPFPAIARVLEVAIARGYTHCIQEQAIERRSLGEFREAISNTIATWTDPVTPKNWIDIWTPFTQNGHTEWRKLYGVRFSAHAKVWTVYDVNTNAIKAKFATESE